MKKIFLLLLLISGLGFSQSISDYKYVIIPAKFTAQSKAGQFGLNNLTKLFLEKNGYIPYYSTDILPPEVSGENCNKIYIDVLEENGLLKTKLKVVIKDCKNAILFTSKYGESTDKDNNIAYNQALRAAFRSFDSPEYKSNPAASKLPVTETKPMPATQQTVVLSENFNDVPLNAQPIPNGFQLVDTTPKIVLKIYMTSQPEVFIAENGIQKGVLHRSKAQWVFEYYQDNKLVSEAVNIKF